MWRKLLAIAHPDRGGTHDLFVWCQGLYEYVAGDRPEPVVDDRSRRERHADDNRNTERIPYEEAFGRAGNFGELTYQAVMFAQAADEPYASLLRMLSDCYAAPQCERSLYKQQHQGATYRSLAAIGHKVSMSKEQRSRWYAICRAIPMSQRHATHLLTRLQSEAA
jgi:hypothetical protein